MPLLHDPIHTLPFEAEAAITAGQCVINGTSDGQCKLPTADGQLVIGVALNDAAIGETVDVCVLGPCLATSNGAVTIGTLVEAKSTTGKVDDFTVAATTVKYVVGRALSASAGGTSEMCSIFVNPGYGATS